MSALKMAALRSGACSQDGSTGVKWLLHKWQLWDYTFLQRWQYWDHKCAYRMNKLSSTMCIPSVSFKVGIEKFRFCKKDSFFKLNGYHVQYEVGVIRVVYSISLLHQQQIIARISYLLTISIFRSYFNRMSLCSRTHWCWHQQHSTNRLVGAIVQVRFNNDKCLNQWKDDDKKLWDPYHQETVACNFETNRRLCIFHWKIMMVYMNMIDPPPTENHVNKAWAQSILKKKSRLRNSHWLSYLYHWFCHTGEMAPYIKMASMAWISNYIFQHTGGNNK